MKTQVEVLSFNENQDRELNIEAAHETTFQWIASQDTILTETNAMDFKSWIDSSHNGLFISGKAASGKSTLMKYIRKTQMALLKNSNWASDPSSVVSAAFFFHERGSDLQKSREGMLRSLLCQILRQVPMRLLNVEFSPKWHSLTPVLQKAIENLESRGKRLFLFLDGLDEFRLMEKIDDYTEEQKDLIYDGGDNDAAWGVSKWIVEGHRDISNFILELCSKRNVKVCFSCRELSVFEGKFRGLPRLQLQKYTRNDICGYSHGRLTMEVPGLHGVDKFATSITDKASGVFLWVKLVVNMLIDGYDAGDNAKELWRTLEHLPDRLGGQNGLYMSMLRHIRQSHRAESARLFKLVESEKRVLHLLQLSFAAESLAGIQKNGLGSCIQIDTMEQPGFSALCETYLRRLKSRCGGLLEADPFVNFMHQTAKEFMQRQFARKTVFDGEPEFTEVNLSSALLQGCIALFRVVKRVPPTDTSDMLWKEPKQGFVSIGYGIYDHIAALDRSCIDAEGYASLVDRINGTEVPHFPLLAYDEELPSLDPMSVKDLPRGPWLALVLKDTTIWGREMSEDSISFAARMNLSKYIKFKLGLQTPSQRVDEACRLWRSYFPFGQNFVWSTYKKKSSEGFAGSRVSRSGIGIKTCKTLIPHVAQCGENGSIKALDVILPAWARALVIGFSYFIDGADTYDDCENDEYEYGQEWPELILLMLRFGVPVNTLVRLSSDEPELAVTLPSSQILLRILEMSRRRPNRDLVLRRLEARVLRRLPKKMSSPPALQDVQHMQNVKIDIE